MTPQELQKILTRDDVVGELHHLLWMEPHVNRGIQDDGWNCRDHALVVAGIVQMLGFTAASILGKATFIHGRKGEVAGMGREVKTHAWVGVDKAGFYYLSVRLSEFTEFPEWGDWKTVGLAGQDFIPAGRVEFRMARSETHFENLVNAATHLEDINTTVYFCETFADLAADDIASGLSRCNSPLTDKLRASFGERQDLHAKAIVHLVDYMNGKTPSITNLPQMDAWAALAARPGDAVFRVCSRGKLIKRLAARQSN